MCVCVLVWDSGSAARDERGVKRLLGRIRLITTWLRSTLIQLLLWDALGIDWEINSIRGWSSLFSQLAAVASGGKATLMVQIK